MDQASPVMCVQAKVVGGFAVVRAVVPEPTIPTLLGVRWGVTGACPGVDHWYYTAGLGPLYRFTFWFNVFDDVVDAGRYLGPFEVLLDIDMHLGNLPSFFIVLTPLS